jgi:hypothetical protein
MTIEYLGNLGSMIGGLAIFVSLLYLAVETRVNTKAIRSAAYHSAAESIADNSVHSIGDPEFRSLLLRSVSLDRVEEFSADEQMQFSTLANVLFLRYEDVFVQYLQGAVPPELWENRRKFARSFLELPTWKAAWEVWKNSPMFMQAFIEEIESSEVVPNAYLGLGGPDTAPSA